MQFSIGWLLGEAEEKPEDTLNIVFCQSPKQANNTQGNPGPKASQPWTTNFSLSWTHHASHVNNLTSLSQVIFQFCSLQTELKNLQRLDLNNAGLTTLEGFPALPELRYVSILGNNHHK